MWHFPMMFWVVALLFWVMATRRRRAWRRWVMVGPGWHPAVWALHEGEPTTAAMVPPSARRPREERDREVEALETRIAELEQRLDFTERLLESRQQRGGARQEH